MSDWRPQKQMTGRDMLKAAAAILGLMAGIILVLWLLSRFLH